MREFIKTYEFIGKLEIEDFFYQENIRCIYEEDYYSNKLMKGHFEVNNLSADLINKLGNFESFKFTDKSNRIINGKINGVSLETEYNSRKDVLKFFVENYTQWVGYSENKPAKVKISYSIPYISFFNRGINFSHGMDDSYIFRFSYPKKVLKLNYCEVIFDDWVYSLKYKNPDSIFKREMFIDIEKKIFDENKKIETVNEIERILKDILVLISFILNHRFSFYNYKAKFYDENGKITETFERKRSEWTTGNEFLKESGSLYYNFKKYSTIEKISLLINNYLENINERDKIKELLFSYLTINEIGIFEPQFLLAFFLLEGISKLIVKPTKYYNCEKLIKEAASKYQIDIYNFDFKISHNKVKKADSKYEWEITELRNNLTHFNNDDYNLNEMYDEFVKMMKLARKLIISYIEPTLSDWPTP